MSGSQVQRVLASLVLMSAACTSFESAPGSANDGGTDGGTSDAPPGIDAPPGCDPSAEPKDAPKCVVDKFGVFVDATGGAETNLGTKASPVKTIATALAMRGGKPRVYVCEGSYAEHVKLTSGVAIYGGFACGTWTYSGTKAKVAPTDAGYALHLDKVADTTVIADLTFVALGGSATAPSSVAAFANASPKVTLRRVELTAGGGFAGKSPVKAADGALAMSTPTPGTLNGNGGAGNVGGFAQVCTCAGGATSKGGGGGNLNGDGNSGESVQVPEVPSAASGGGQTAAQCAISGSGTRGSDAPNVLAAAGAKRRGDVTETGWIPEAGKSGAAGGAGQGGGGGGGAGGGGGGGACGGCGGAAGESGGGGGASVALLALNSPVSLAACVLKTADAGDGGTGGAGGDGIAGGAKGARGGVACDGGNGGNGGKGGAGGGGAGGVSVGVLSKGAKPAIDATITTGSKGGPGNGGVDGQKADTLEIQ